MLQGSTLDRSGAFRSGTLPPCTVWPRTVMRGKSRKLTSGHNSVPKSARRTEPSPRNPRLAANASLSGQRKVKGVSRGDIGNRRCPTSPFAPAVGTAFPVGGHRQSPRRGHGVSAARRRQCPACPSAAILASSGEPLYRRMVCRLLTVNILPCDGRPPERRNRSPSCSSEGVKGRCPRRGLPATYKSQGLKTLSRGGTSRTAQQGRQAARRQRP